MKIFYPMWMSNIDMDREMSNVCSPLFVYSIDKIKVEHILCINYNQRKRKKKKKKKKKKRGKKLEKGKKKKKKKKVREVGKMENVKIARPNRNY